MLPSMILMLFGVLVPGIHSKKKLYEKDFELAKPLVVPASEADFHNTMIQVDTDAGSQQAIYGMIGVMLLDGVFTFSGIPTNYFPKLKTENGQFCLPFKGINTVHKCQKQYFLLNADFINLQKTVVNKANTNFEEVCSDENQKAGAKAFNVANDPKGKLVVRFGARVLMTFKYDNNHHKCIGTYDQDDDLFSCVWLNEKNELQGLELPGFLFDPITGKAHRADNTVEIFCKVPWPPTNK